MKQLKNLAIERSKDEDVNRKVIEVLKGLGYEDHTSNVWLEGQYQYVGYLGSKNGYEEEGLYHLWDSELKGRTKITASDFLSQYAPKEETELRVGMRVKSLVLNRMKHCPIGSVGTITHRGNHLGVQFDSGKYGIYELEGSGLVPIQEEEKPVPCDVPQYEVTSNGKIIDDDRDEIAWVSVYPEDFKLVTHSGTTITNIISTKMKELNAFIKGLTEPTKSLVRLGWLEVRDGDYVITEAGKSARDLVDFQLVPEKTVGAYAVSEVERLEKEKKSKK